MFDRNRQSARRNLDKLLDEIRPLVRRLHKSRGWIRTIRRAYGMSGTQMAKRMGLTRQRLSQMEDAEAKGNLTLSNLRRAAEALDCQLVYAFVPVAPLEDMVNGRARQVAIRELKRVTHSMDLEDQSPPSEDGERRIKEYIDDHIRESDLWADE